MKVYGTHLIVSIVLIMALALVSAPGCGDHDHAKPEVTSVESEEMGHSHDSAAGGHSHGEGAHGGQVVVIGDHVAHMEVVHHDDNGEYTLYITDAGMDKPMPSETPVLFNIKTPEGPRQLKMQPKEGSAVYEAEAPELKRHVIEGQIALSLGGKEYFVALPEHDDDHDHDGEPADMHDDDHDHDGEPADMHDDDHDHDGEPADMHDEDHNHGAEPADANHDDHDHQD